MCCVVVIGALSQNPALFAKSSPIDGRHFLGSLRTADFIGSWVHGVFAGRSDIDMGASHVRNILFESFLGLVGDRLAVEL